MKAIEVPHPGGPEVLRLVERPEPVAGLGQALVRVLAANINPTDLVARAGMLPPGVTAEPPFVLGWDFSGEVVSVGAGVADFEAGDRVIGMIPWYEIGGTNGTYAERIVVEADWIVPLPNDVDEVAAATLPVNALTATQIVELLDPRSGSELLVTGASGAVGGFVVQLAAQAGCVVTAIAGHDDQTWVAELGASTVHDRDVDPAAIGRFSRVVDAVPLGAPVLAAVTDGGHVVSTRPGPDPDPRRKIRSEFLMVRYDRSMLRGLVESVGAGKLQPGRVARTYPLERAAEAHELAGHGGLRGKVLLLP